MKTSFITKIICILMLISMLVSVTPLAVFAEELDGVETDGAENDGNVEGGAADPDEEIDYSTARDVFSADELEAALSEGSGVIRIATDFLIDRTFFVITDTVIFADEPHTLTRASNFGGDIFVIGETPDGEPTNEGVKFTVGKPEDTTEGLISINGNSENMTVDVVGTVFFVRGGSSLYLYSGISVTNCNKTGNERTLDSAYSLSYPPRIGGAVAIVSSKAAMKIFGGTYSENRVNDITDSSTDEGNKSSQGGVIYNYGNLEIYGGTFENNHAGRGGVFYNYRTMNIYNAEIISNTASSLGGAIYVPNSTSAYLYIGEETEHTESRVRFIGNVSEENGGAIYAQHVGVIKNTEFISNVTTVGNGGAISAGAMELSIENSSFVSNAALDGYGGAIYITGSNGDEDIRELIVSGAEFEENTATRGGAVYMSGSSRAYFAGTAFEKNLTTSYGGALYVTNASAELNGVEFKANKSDSNGGAIALYSSSNAVLNNVTADSNEGKLGGFMYVNASAADLYNSTLNANSAVDNGGGVYAYTDAVFNAYNTKFIANTAGGNGAGAMIYNGGKGSVLHSCTFENNVAGSTGGGLYISNKSQVDIYNVTATANSADKGGFMYETTAGTVVKLVGATVSGNTATTGGPIIWGNTINAKLYIDQIKYVDKDYNGDWNEEYWASAIYNLLKVYNQTGTVPEYLDYNGQTVIPPVSASITNVSTAAQLERALQVGYTFIRITADFSLDRTFYINYDVVIFADEPHTLVRAADFAGDIFVVGEDEDGNKPEVEITFSLGKRDGSDSSLTIDGNSQNMTVDVVGTVVFVCDGSRADLGTKLTVTNNVKVGNDRTNGEYRVSYPPRIGGAVAIIENGAELNVWGGVYSNNRTNDITDANTDEGSLSSHGGAFYNHGLMNVYGGVFENNHAGRGGAFYNYRTLNIYSATIRNNTASTFGGAIYMPNSTSAFLYIGEDCAELEGGRISFISNSAVDGGGALYARNLVVIKNTEFSLNTVTEGHGGAIYAATTRMTLDGVVFSENFTQKYAGAIYLTGNNEREETLELVANNTTFVNNSATSRGGAVYISASARAYLKDASITYNTSAVGGAFYITGGSVEINGATLSFNVASSSNGGAISLNSSSTALLNGIYAYGNRSTLGGMVYATASNLDIYNSTVSGNIASNNGGGIYAYTDAVFNAYNTVFTENTADKSGGGVMVYNGGKDSVIHSCSFIANAAGEAGGGIYISNKSQVYMYNNVATNNSAPKGGFMYETTSGTVVTLVGLTVSGNTATTGGPIIWGNTKNAKLKIDKSKYTDLDATGALDSAYWSAAIYNLLTTSEITGSVPKYLDYGNEAYDEMIDAVDVANADELEAAIKNGVKHIRVVADFEIDRTFYITGEVTIFSTIAHTLTRAADFGGDMFVVGEGEDGVSSLIIGKTATLNLGNPYSVLENLLVIDGNDGNMTLDVVGSVVFITESATVNLYTNVTVENCRKVNNERTFVEAVLSVRNRIGGALAIVASGILNIYGGNYRNNKVNEEIDSTENGRISSVGGLIFNNGNLNIYGGTFENNFAARGAVIYNYRIVRILGGSFIGNTAGVSGGVYYSPNSAQVHLYVNNPDLTGAPVVFKDNVAKSSGGAIYASALTANVIYGGATFENNSVLSGSGGAICMYGQLTVRGSKFIGNTASNRGGAIYTSKSSADAPVRHIEITRCTFVQNEATLGGAVSLLAGSTDFNEGALINVADTVFTGNIASVEIGGASSACGGAVYLDRRSTASFDSCEFSANKATTEAGAIYIAGESTVKLNSSTLSENTAGKYGGAIAVRSSYLYIDGTNILSNASENNGGAVYVSYQSTREINSKVEIKNSIIKNNSTKANGGGIYVTRHNVVDEWNILTLINSVLEGNSAAANGGALYTLSDVGVYVADSTFESNKAVESESSIGGAIFASGSKLEIDATTFTLNESFGGGGAIFLDNSADAVMNEITANLNVGYSGGFIYLDGQAKLSLYNSNISCNEAKKHAGAIYSVGNSVLNVYSTTFTGNISAENAGAVMIYNGGSKALIHSSTFVENKGGTLGGALYISNKSIVDIYNVVATANSAQKGGFMYETTSGSVVTLVGVAVSGNTATVGGDIIWGNTENAKLKIDKSKYTDLDAVGALDEAYWSEAIYNALTVEKISSSVPSYTDYKRVELEVEVPVSKPTVSVDHVFDLAQNSSDGYINATYDKFPLLDNSSNFMSDKTTYFKDINGETVSVDSFVYNTRATDGNVNFGQGMLIYQAMLYKLAHPEEDVSIAVSSYRLSVVSALNINRNGRYFGYMRNLYGMEYDAYGFVRISYLLVTAAKMGINVTVIGHIDGYPISSADPNLYEYFTGHMDTPCDPNYTNGVVGDYLNFAQCYWTLEGKGGTDMMHNKMCAVSHYVDMNGVEHKNAVFSSSANLDGINSSGTNGNWKLQTATIVSDHEYIYKVAVNYLNLLAAYSKQEQIYEFQDIMSIKGKEQIDLILDGKLSEIPEDELIVYLGTENDDVFELYFTPFAGPTTVWSEKYNPYTRYIRYLYDSEGSIIFSWNAAEYNAEYNLGQQMEMMISEAFHKNKNVENKFFGNMEFFNQSLMADLVVGEDIGYLSINEYPFGEVHNKDILMSYVKDGQRYYVSLLNSCNMHSGSMCYQSNFMLVIKEKSCDEDSVFFTMADLSTTGLVEHAFDYETEQIFIPEDNNHGYYYVQCKHCDKKIITGTVHRPGEWVIDRAATPEQNGVKHKECTVCGSILEIVETMVEELEYQKDNDFSSGVKFGILNKIDTNIVQSPKTIEALIKLPKSYINRGGVIVGNYDISSNNVINVEVYTNGRLRLYVKNNGIISDCRFSVDVRSDCAVHIAIVIDGDIARLYVNGMFAESQKIGEIPETSAPFVIGGDHRQYNTQYFKGEIYSVSMFDDVRSPEEIKRDCLVISQDTEGLMYSRTFATIKKPDLSQIHGATFNGGNSIFLDKLSATPHTFEAIIKLSKNYNGRAGVVVGNYDGGGNSQINLEIMENGQPRLYFSQNGVAEKYLFNYDIRSDAAIHIAVTVSGKTARLYVNGELVSSITMTSKLPIATDNFVVGGDNRTANAQYFKGEIYAVGLYSRARTEEEIKKDCVMLSQSDDSLVYLNYFAEEQIEENDTVYGENFAPNKLTEVGMLSSVPHTVEAVVKLSPNEYERGGIIFGNYDNGTGAQLNIEVYYLGEIRVYYNDGVSRCDCVFSGIDVRSTTGKHIAVTMQDKEVRLYVDGVLAGVKTMLLELPSAVDAFKVGGDNRVGNAQFFKGEILSVDVFSDVRTDAEVKADYLSGSVDDESRIWAVDFISSNNKKTQTQSYRPTGEIYDGEGLDNIGIKTTPHTIEAVVKLPKDHNGRGGVILGGYWGNYDNQLTFEIHENGRVRLFFVNEGIRVDTYFNVDVRSDAPVYLALTLDGTVATLYVNGIAAETLGLPMPVCESTVMEYCIGGDMRIDNLQYFKGEIYSVNLFSDVRSAEEIRCDAAFVSENADNLLYSSYKLERVCNPYATNGNTHVWSNWIEDYAPTEHSSGLEHIECKVCGIIRSQREVSSTRKDGDSIKYDEREAMTFETELDTKLLDKLAASPLTFEILLQLDPSHSGRAGVIIGSYDAGDGDAINIEMYTNGNPRLYYKVGGVGYSYVFSYDVRSTAMTHIAITVDGLVARLYVNGDFVEEIKLSTALPEITEGFRVGSDNRPTNPQFFSGKLYAIHIFDDVRTEAEISSDALFITGDAKDGLVYSEIYAKEK